MNEDDLLKPREVAKWLGVHQLTIKRMSDKGELPYYRIGSRGDRRYSRVDIEKYLEGRFSGREHGAGQSSRNDRSAAGRARSG